MDRDKIWDVFISHASEDKEIIARPIAHALINMGLSVWFDEFELSAGDSLRESIDHGLSNSKYGIVIISKSFLNKKWTKRELAGLFAKEDKGKVIIPVWHEVTEEIVRSYSPMLADRVALKTSDSIDDIIRDLLRAMNLPFSGQELTGIWYGITGRLRLFEVSDFIEGDYDWNGRDWGAHLRGKFANGTLFFDWWWDFSPERGGGYFIFKEKRLDGEWWLGQNIDGTPVEREKNKYPKNPWRYSRTNY